MPIQALPKPSIIQLSSGQVLLNPSTAIKELLDNALDANATSISIELSANTTDYIQVRDNGVGVEPEDRGMLGRRYCTSKVRTLQDVARLGGKSLGFRGEALSSLVTLSERVEITTRIEGENVGVKLLLFSDAAKSKREMMSHPIGTTVRAVNLFHDLPVRKQTAEKDSSKILGNIRAIVKSYVVARPTVRFTVRVSKSRSDKFNFTYAPAKTEVSVKEAAMNLFGRDCVNECALLFHREEGFELELFHPMIGSDVSKVSGHGHFISIDKRPVVTRTGLLRGIMTKYREILKQHDSSFNNIQDPFLCLNIVCPEGSYDPNVEPLKNDVIFGDSKTLLDIIERCFLQIYNIVAARGTATRVLPVVHDFGDVHELPRDAIIDGHIANLSRLTPSQSEEVQAAAVPIEEQDLTSPMVFQYPPHTGPDKCEGQYDQKYTAGNLLDQYDFDEENLPLFSRALKTVDDSTDDYHVPNAGLSPWVLAKMNASTPRIPLTVDATAMLDSTTTYGIDHKTVASSLDLTQRAREPLKCASRQLSSRLNAHERESSSGNIKSILPASITGLSFFTNSPDILESSSSQLPTPVASSSPLHRDHISYSSSSFQQASAPSKHSTFTDRLISRNTSHHETSRSNGGNRDIRNMLPRMKTHEPDSQCGKSQRRSPRRQQASTNLYNQISYSPLRTQMAYVEPRDVAEPFQPHRNLEARFPAELMNGNVESVREKRLVNAPFKSPLTQGTPASNYHSPEALSDVNDPITPSESLFNKRSQVCDNATREKSHSRRCCSLSRSQPGTVTCDVSTVVSRTNALSTMGHCYDFLGDDDIVPWSSLEDMQWETDMPGLCRHFAVLWTPILRDLIHVKFPETDQYLEMESEVTSGLLCAAELKLE